MMTSMKVRKNSEHVRARSCLRRRRLSRNQNREARFLHIAWTLRKCKNGAIATWVLQSDHDYKRGTRQIFDSNCDQAAEEVAQANAKENEAEPENGQSRSNQHLRREKWSALKTFMSAKGGVFVFLREKAWIADGGTASIFAFSRTLTN